jgi:heme oxygenase (biliverdin-IX-beta and delta-forming)
MRSASATCRETNRTTTRETELYNGQMTFAHHDILTALRDATASRHAELDGGMPLARPAPTLADYRAHLALLQRWLEPIEAWQARFADGPQDAALLPREPHLPLIEADLADPSLPVGHEQAGAAAWQGRDSAPYRWGVSYVIEGSRLGGAVLYRRLAAPLAPHPLRYLHGGGVPPGPRWQQFIRTLRAHVQGEAAVAEACRGARDAFDSLIALHRAAASPAAAPAASLTDSPADPATDRAAGAASGAAA